MLPISSEILIYQICKNKKILATLNEEKSMLPVGDP